MTFIRIETGDGAVWAVGAKVTKAGQCNGYIIRNGEWFCSIPEQTSVEEVYVYGKSRIREHLKENHFAK